MVVQQEQCSSLWRIGELTLKPFQLELAQFAMRNAKTPAIQQQNSAIVHRLTRV